MKKINSIIFFLLLIIVVYLGYNHNKSLTPQQFDDSFIKWQEWKVQQENEGVAEKLKITEGDYIYGSKDAEITIFEYSDFECPFCKKFSKTAKTIVDKSNGKVNTVFRHFPLAFHNPLATQAAVSAECVAEQKGSDGYYAFNTMYFEKTKAGGKGIKLDEVFKIAENIGVDKEKFNTCFKSGKYELKIQESLDAAVKLGVNGTPGVLIKNNKTNRVIKGAGAEPIESIESKIDSLR